MINYVIFDLDGTLLYTLDTILYHLNRTLVANGLREITLSQCSDFIGDGAKKLVKRAVEAGGVFDGELTAKVLGEYNAAYNSDPLPHTHPYDGISSLIDELISRGITLGVVTNKPEPTARQLVAYFFGDKISAVRGGRAGAVLKPDPTDSLDMLSTLGGDPSECAFVGDTPVDITTARNMGAALSLGVSWGFRTREELESQSPGAIADTPAEALDIILGFAKE